MAQKDEGDFAAYYARRWLDTDPYFSMHQDRFIESWRFLSDIEWRGARVLDIGGLGPLACFAAEHRSATAFHSTGDLRSALPIPSNAADVILCTETIEHIKDVEGSTIADLESFNYSGMQRLLSEMHRIGRPGCRVFMTTPNASSLITLERWIRYKILLMNRDHVRELNVKELVFQCAQAGLDPLKVETVDVWRGMVSRRTRVLARLLWAAGVAMDERGDNIFGLFEVRK